MRLIMLHHVAGEVQWNSFHCAINESISSACAAEKLVTNLTSFAELSSCNKSKQQPF